jgi:cysteine desulfurase/selenocysteine lyase
MFNALGTVLPVRSMIEERARRAGAGRRGAGRAAQIGVTALDTDFYCFSGHKMFAPTGIGALIGKAEHLEAMAPWQGGGDMIASVSFEKTTYNRVPFKFEAGTPNIAGAVGIAAAADYLDAVGLEAIAAYEHELLEYGTRALSQVPGLTIVGTAREKASVLSFTLAYAHPHDVGTILDAEGIAIRTGHHCAQPVMERFGIPATARASLAFYNTREEIDALVSGLAKVQAVFGS